MVAATHTTSPVLQRARGPEVGVRGRWQPLSGALPAPRPVLYRWVRRFAGTTGQVGQARRFTELLLADSGEVGVDAGWVVGELSANAVKHSRSGAVGGWFTVEVTRTRRYVDVRVIDAGGPGRPRVRTGGPVVGEVVPEAGLGLYGVGALVSLYGTFGFADGRRVVWARLTAGLPGVMGAVT